MAVILFSSLIWGLWKEQNENIFRGISRNPNHIVEYSRRLTQDLANAKSLNNANITREPRWISWRTPPTDQFTLNANGAWNRSSKIVGAGGLIRNCKGKWVMGFIINIGKANHVLAELWGLRKGLNFAKTLGLKQLIVEIDSQEAIEFLQTDESEDVNLKSVIEGCKKLLKDLEVKNIRHILREANRCADSLAKLGLNEEEEEKILNEPPEILSRLLDFDRKGKETLRM